MDRSGSTDDLIRTAAIAYVAEVTGDGEMPITWHQLSSGFVFGGWRIPLVSQQGIFKPARLDLPISIRTTPPRPDRAAPYPDEITADGYLSYAYRGTDPDHRDNRMLREVMHRGTTLLYLQGITRGVYQASAAVILRDDPAVLRFEVALLPLVSVVAGLTHELVDITQRHHYLRLVRQRAHQALFRSNVLRAYRTRCTVCSLGHAELLDAAHIVSDRGGGEPVIPNGFAMCKIHHAAFDADILGVRPGAELVAEVRRDVLEEVDGPMLQHGIQGVHGRRLVVPTRPEWRPDPVGVERRYERFRRAS